MKYVKKKKNSYGGLIVTIAILVVLILGMVAWLLAGRSNGDQQTAAEMPTARTETGGVEEPTVPEEIVPATKPVDVVELLNGEIETPYGVLRYPDALSDHLIIVQTSEDPYTLSFYASMEGKQETLLFDISLGENSGGNMGVAQMESGAVPVNVTIYTLTFNEAWTEGEMTTAYAMQDVVNEIIEALAPEKKTEESAESVIIQQPESQETVNYIEIITAYHTLYYPGRWKSTLRTEHLELQDENMYKVHFYGRLENREEQLLFSIYFGGDEGEQLGAVMGPDGIPVPVNILMAELDVTDLTESEQETLYSMQEASNELIQMIDYID